jgi:iron-sulfur cluster assembly protein
MAISLSESAATRVLHFLHEKPQAVGLRLGVKRTGCSGYAYVINYADAIEAKDHVFTDRGVKIIVDAESLALIDGTQVDFVRQGLNEAFKFKNPKAKGECGCGESFTP